MAKKKPASVPSDKPAPITGTLTPPPGYKGVTELRFVRAGDLALNPANWRKHPERQVRALQTSIAENGWAGACLYNLTTSRLIDGHARQGIDPDQVVPVLIGSFTIEQERRILATLDPIAAMAEENAEALKLLIDSVSVDLDSLEAAASGAESGLRELVDELKSEATVLTGGDPRTDSLVDSWNHDKEQLVDNQAITRMEERRRLPCPHCGHLLTPEEHSRLKS